MRWWIYQKERFPLFAHGPLILAFSACAVSFSALVRDAPVPSWAAYATAFVVCLLMFLQLRIADEFKDAEEDKRWRPYRAVPRGLVQLSELRLAFVAAGLIQAIAALTLDWRLLGILLVAWLYLGLMCAEFFCRNWLKARPVVYLISHMGIMPLVDFFATSCEWLPGGGMVPANLSWFLCASFTNGLTIELGRKLRRPENEEMGVETYSKLWGIRKAAGLWLGTMVLTMTSAGLAAWSIDFAAPFLMAMGVLFLAAVVAAFRYVNGAPGKVVEGITGGWTMGLYLMLGIVPLILR